MDEIMIEARGLVKRFQTNRGLVHRRSRTIIAVDDVDLTISKGEAVGLVGESGCGKSTVGRCMLNLLRPTAGHVYFQLPSDERRRLLELQPYIEGHGDGPTSGNARAEAEIEELRSKYALDRKNAGDMRALRKKIQMLSQDVSSALDPRMNIRQALEEPLIVHKVAGREHRAEMVSAAFGAVGLDPSLGDRFPHQLSGGQKQRVGIARAMILGPELIVLDEPTSSLDVSVQAQILNLLRDLQAARSMAYLFISHDLSVVRYMCDRVVVMYLGRIVEVAHKKDLFDRPLHPYTESLLSSIPIADPRARKRTMPLPDELSYQADNGKGCRFCIRCRYRNQICRESEPILREVSDGHLVACHIR